LCQRILRSNRDVHSERGAMFVRRSRAPPGEHPGFLMCSSN
jgi:hypothetical protein